MDSGIIINEIAVKIWKIFRFFLIVGLSFILLYPLIYMISVSFRPYAEMLDPSIIWIPRNLTVENFTSAFKNMNYLKSFSNTLLVGGVSSIIQTFSCCLVAYGFARFKFRERNFMFALVLLTIIVPPQVTLIPLYLMFNRFGLPFVSLILENTTGYVFTVNLLGQPVIFYLQALFGMGIRSGLYIFLLRQFLRGFPLELEEAAEIDGTSPFGTFIRVILPNTGSMLLTVSLFSIVWYWNDYYYAINFLGDNKTLAIALAFLRSAFSSDDQQVNSVFESLAKMQAGALLFILPLLILYIFMQRYFTESIERSGLVG